MRHIWSKSRLYKATLLYYAWWLLEAEKMIVDFVHIGSDLYTIMYLSCITTQSVSDMTNNQKTVQGECSAPQYTFYFYFKNCEQETACVWFVQEDS